MPLFMDTHKKGHGLTAEEVVKAHQRDLEVQASMFRDGSTKRPARFFCLVEAHAEAPAAVHR